ncbi:MAG: M16 family metallopeptidase, partial [Bryobacteraceae bacterium]
LPIVNGLALVRTGNLFDPAGKVGLAQLTGMVQRTGGTRQQTGDALDERLENIAASVESQIGESSGTVSFSTLKENADEVLEIFRDLLTAPEFRSEKLDLAKTELRSGISRRNDEAGGIARREFASIVYGRDNSYGWPMEFEHVDRVRRDDLVAFYQRYYFPGNVMLAVYGDFSAAEMKAKLGKLFGGWTATQPPVPPFPPAAIKPAAGVYLAAKGDVTQTFFAVGHAGGMLNDKDYAALEVMADILGGGFRSRLFQKVRGQLGYAYSIGAQWGAQFRHPGLFHVSGSTKALATLETLQAIEQEIARMRDTPVTDAELDAAKQAVQNSFVFHFDTRTKTIGRMLNYEYFGYPPDFLFQYQKAVAAVTKAEIQRVARERLKPQELVMVAVGNPKDFIKPLSGLGRTVRDLDLTIPQPKVEAASSDAASLERGQAMLARVQQALGGAEKIAAVKDQVMVNDVQLDPAAGGMKVKQTNRWADPGFFRQELELPFGKITSYSDGKSGWIVHPRGDGALMGAQLKQVQGEIFRWIARLALSDRVPGRTVNHSGAGEIEISDGEGNSARLTIDEATGLPARLTYPAPQGGDVQETWSEWREVGGIRLPHKITVFQGGKKYADVEVKEARVNTGATGAQLSKRP